MHDGATSPLPRAPSGRSALGWSASRSSRARTRFPRPRRRRSGRRASSPRGLPATPALGDPPAPGSARPLMAASTVARMDSVTPRALWPTRSRALHGVRWRSHGAPATGLVIGLALIAATAFESGPVETVIALLAVVMAVIAPPIGLATAAFTITLAGPDVFRPLGFFVVLILALVVGVAIRHIVAPPPETPSALTILGVGYAVLIVASLPPIVSGLGVEDTTGAVFEAMQLIGGLALLAVARTLFATVDWRPYLRLALGGAVAAAILALVRMAFGIEEDLPLRGLFGHGEATYRAVGPFTNSNYFGMLAAVASVMTFALATRRTGASRLVWLACSAVLAIGTVLSFSRGAVLALAVGLVAGIWS